MDNAIPFPQADDFEKVISLLKIDDEEDLQSNMKISIQLGEITDRQVNYYLSAAAYLGLIEGRKYTELGKKIREYDLIEQRIELIRLILSDEVFGTIYITEKRLGIKLSKEEIIDIMKKTVSFNSEEMFKRRAQTVASWVAWIHNELNDNV